ncbi:hypothetical protein DID76_03610 [Candidatus Marinamargulisbacteria bacterium SCGC AG-414-C22]|nr:hypothetical protein DID76_03610 [Candidatus Marinamargulisbacteria bacterium SCGC AG-414-C22]
MLQKKLISLVSQRVTKKRLFAAEEDVSLNQNKKLKQMRFEDMPFNEQQDCRYGEICDYFFHKPGGGSGYGDFLKYLRPYNKRDFIDYAFSLCDPILFSICLEFFPDESACFITDVQDKSFILSDPKQCSFDESLYNFDMLNSLCDFFCDSPDEPYDERSDQFLNYLNRLEENPINFKDLKEKSEILFYEFFWGTRSWGKDHWDAFRYRDVSNLSSENRDVVKGYGRYLIKVCDVESLMQRDFVKNLFMAGKMVGVFELFMNEEHDTDEIRSVQNLFNERIAESAEFNIIY